MCTGEEKLAGEPGGRKGWRRRQAERAAETPPAVFTPAEDKKRERGGREEGEWRERQRVERVWGRASQ